MRGQRRRPGSRGQGARAPRRRWSAHWTRHGLRGRRAGGGRSRLLLAALVLVAPIVVAANPADPSWIPGFYDDADSDQLTSQAMTPESLLGADLPILLCLVFTAAAVWPRRSVCRVAVRRVFGARGPPVPCGVPASAFSARRLGHSPACLSIQHASCRSRGGRPLVRGSDTAALEDAIPSHQPLAAEFFWRIPPFHKTVRQALPSHPSTDLPVDASLPDYRTAGHHQAEPSPDVW